MLFLVHFRQMQNVIVLGTFQPYAHVDIVTCSLAKVNNVES